MKKIILLPIATIFLSIVNTFAANFEMCIIASGTTSGTITVTLTNNTGSPINVTALSADITPSPNCTLTPAGGTRQEGSRFGIVSAGSTSFSINFSGVTGFTTFTMSNTYDEIDGNENQSIIPLGCATAALTAFLPVELTNLTATPLSKTAKLEWLTASEKNSSHFEIERSSDGKVFDKIGIIKSNGNTYSKQSYELIDEKPFQGINYYRLKMVDLDASFEYSKIVSVWMDKKGKDKIFTIAPNPARGNVNFNIFNGEESEAILDVRDIAGREIYHKKLNKADNIQNIDWNTEGVSKGVYFVTLTADGERITKKLILN